MKIKKKKSNCKQPHYVAPFSSNESQVTSEQCQGCQKRAGRAVVYLSLLVVVVKRGVRVFISKG
ncbi:hypothetical protein E2C01_069891 [Portunus trituberculatus]|uniref:Uncharacterized protein n=1 Tax=Portunus trituberculatus TaxID=210409 RepID=A0A5B7HR82_PORTR|nr:hypothetical protein [Portunus trituberculatus]